ncbi:hypothetical protein V6N13_074885 [Hibiscus sabdariffa]
MQPHDSVSSAYGPWMQVDKRQRRPIRKPQTKEHKQADKGLMGSRFNPIYEDDEDLQTTDGLQGDVDVLAPSPTKSIRPDHKQKGKQPTVYKHPRAIHVRKPLRNVQGCGHPKFCSIARQYLRDTKPDLVVFVEPRISGIKADRIIASLGFPNSHRVEALGFSGGIWLVWFNSIKIKIELNHFQFIHCRITTTRDGSHTLATVIYASPNATKHKALWSNLQRLAPNINTPWILFGDFNATLCSSDRSGGALSTKPNKLFQDFVYDFGLRDMGYNGPDFTWNCGSTQARLDRFICNSYWDESYPASSVQHLLRIKSDHRPILLKVGNATHSTSNPQFRYLSSWSLHNDFDRMVSDNWKPGSTMTETINTFAKAADTWNKTIYGYIGTKKRVIMARLRGIQKALCIKSSRFLINLESELMIELENILNQEELLWRQKSCSDWVISGDRNTKYFHRRAICRKQKSRISSLKLPNGKWCSDETTLRAEASLFFESLFTASNDLSLHGNFPLHAPLERNPHPSQIKSSRPTGNPKNSLTLILKKDS